MTALMGIDTRLRLSRLYLCSDARRRQGDLADFCEAVLAGGVDLLQIRDKGLDREAELEALAVAREAAQRHQALVAVNDSPALAGEIGADVLHVGQDDTPAAEARPRLHRWARIGLSTHDRSQADAALADPEVDYFCVGPVWATPTKPTYAPAGLDLVRHATRIAPPGDPAGKPWFAIGGIDSTTVEPVLEAGARRIVVVRAICDADDPGEAALTLSRRMRRAWHDDEAMQRYAFAATAPSDR